MVTGLSAKQTEVFDFIQKTLRAGKPFPSLSEIAAFFSVSKNTAKFHVQALERKGVIKKREERISSFSLTSEEKDSAAFEWVGSIAAGYPDESSDEMSEPLNFDPRYFSKGEVKVLTVNGDSMLGDSICDGDLALVTMQKTFRKNDIVAVRVEAEGITLKRLEKEGEKITLIPSNPRFKKKTFSSEEVSVLGKFVGLVRKA